MPPNAIPFAGQHNVEYYGHGEYHLFDDAVVVGFEPGNPKNTSTMNCDKARFISNSSRMIIFKIDESARTAQVVWRYATGDRTTVYGDNDRLPSGNLLGASWASAVGPRGDDGAQYDCRAYEVERATQKRAWEVRVQGKPCGYTHVAESRGERARLAPNSTASVTSALYEAPDSAQGPSVWGSNISDWCSVQPQNDFYPNSETWKMYSIERFYEAPLVVNVSCAPGGSAISASVYGIGKNSFRGSARYAVRDDGGASVSSAFKLEPFWLPTALTVAAKDGTQFTRGSLVVDDARGHENTTVRYSCV